MTSWQEPSYYVSDYFEAPEARERLSRIVGPVGKRLGCGAWGCAYKLPGAMVVKISGDEDEAPTWAVLQKLQREHDLRGIPWIERVVELETKDGTTLGAVVRENVEPATVDDVDRDLEDELHRYEERAQWFYQAVAGSDELQEVAREELSRVAAEIAEYPNARTMGDTLMTLADSDVPPSDLHLGNIGVRKSGQFGEPGDLVVLDPGSSPTGHGVEIREKYVANMRRHGRPQVERQRMRKNDVYGPFEEHLRGGAAAGMRPEDFDEDALTRGIAHELEHTDNDMIAMEIAMDHLAEDPLYYDKIEAMEEGDMETLERLQMAANQRVREHRRPSLPDPYPERMAEHRLPSPEDLQVTTIFDMRYREALARGASPNEAWEEAALASGEATELEPNAQCPEGTVVQTLLFARDRFTPAKAKAWAKRNDYHHGYVDTTEQYHRLRQHDPGDFRAGSFRTITLGGGVKAVIGCPR